MGRLINVGYGNVVNTEKIISIISPDSAPIKRLVQTAKDNGNAVDVTQGRRTRAVIITESNHVILSALLPETIANRYHCNSEELDVHGNRGEQDE